MKVEIKDDYVQISYIPKTVVIKLETQDEFNTLCHVLGCWCNQELCDRTTETKQMAKTIFDAVIGGKR